MNFFQRVYKSFVQGPIYIVLFGLIFFGVGGGLTYRQIVFRQDAVETSGAVKGFSESCDDDGCSYTPRVDFMTQAGESISYWSTFSSNPPAYDLGEQVTVYYKADNPEKAMIKGEGGVLRVVFMAVGGAVMLGGMAFFAANIRSSYLSEP